MTTITMITIMTTTTAITATSPRWRRLEALSRRGDAIGVAQDRQAARSRQVLPLGAGSGAAKEGPSILRCKGILSFKDDPERFVFQGVHMILDGDHQRPWQDGEKRESRIVFIGRKLPERTRSARVRELHRVMGLRGR